MIRILIVDDSPAKQEQIKKTIIESTELNSEDLTCIGNVNDAKKELYESVFDLMILDLVLPLAEGTECKAENGVGLLKNIEVNPSIKRPIHILGLTGFRDQIDTHKTSFSDKLWNLIHYESDSALWRDRLTSMLYHLISVRKNFLKKSIEDNLAVISKYKEDVKLPNTDSGISWESIIEKLCFVIENSLTVPSYFRNGTKATHINVDSIKLDNEYDFQNLIHLVVRPWVPSMEPENIAIIIDGNTKNADFSVRNNSLIIEAKHINSNGKKNEVIKTLDGLSSFYEDNSNVKAVLFLILIDKGVTIDKVKIEEKYSRFHDNVLIITKFIENNLKP